MNTIWSRLIGSALLLLLFTCASALSAAGAETVRLSSLDLRGVEQDWGRAQADKSVDGRALSIGAQRFEHGLGTNANSTVRVALNGKAEKFTAKVSVDDEVGKGTSSVGFKVVGDGKTFWESPVLRGGDVPKEVSMSLRGVKSLLLLVDGGADINYDYADWADAQFLMAEGKPEIVAAPSEPACSVVFAAADVCPQMSA